MMLSSRSILLKFVLGIILLIFYCEFLIYYYVLSKCSYRSLEDGHIDHSVPQNHTGDELKAMILSDTHLLGPYRGHWLDKLRREWQMHRAFQSAVTLHRPEIIFILGDVFDEGLWTNEHQFDLYVKRFHSLFTVEKPIELFVVPGNHDIGFHYQITEFLEKRFSSALNAAPVSLVSRKNVHFILINSMAMEGDGCQLCQKAERRLDYIAARFRCTKGVGKCKGVKVLPSYSRPVILQHFPMYRESDEECHEFDSAPPEIKAEKFRERWECLSREASEKLMSLLQPRIIMTGHTHHGCHRFHPSEKANEYTVPSFSWRNKNDPTFILALFTPNNFSVERCPMPQESTIILIYIFGIIANILYLLLSRRESKYLKRRSMKTC